jgi:hypothetical protein
MNVSSAASVARTQATMASKEAAETPGAPEHDGDADEAASAAASVKAAPAPGTGTRVDKTA